jgi:hypothetical protein
VVSSIPIFVINNEFIQFVSVCIVGAFSYLILIWFFALSEEERIIILNLKKRVVFQADKLLSRNK